MTPTTGDGDYILGTDDDEVVRLGLQHSVWRPRALDAWQRAGFTAGHTLLDVGCGPGHAAVDLAQVVGPLGQVLALDRSRRFLDALLATACARGLSQLTVQELDLENAELPRIGADGAWCRWVLSFVKQPRDLIARIGGALRAGGALVLHEYFNYAAWRVTPRCRELEEFVGVVMASWRADGGEPDIGLDLPIWLGESGYDVRAVRPFIDVVSSSSPVWRWPETFFYASLSRLVHLSYLAPERARAMAEAFARVKTAPGALMVTPAVLEIIAVRR
jgi:SAM-dependent methyltransferase